MYFISRVIYRKLSNFVLLFMSLFFYAWGEPKYIFVILISIVLNYCFGLWIDSSNMKNQRQIALGTAVFSNIALLVTYKYINFFVDNLNSILPLFKLPEIANKPIHLPLGISFFTFQAMSYVIDVYRKTSPAQKNPINIALYISLFPQLIAGPIVRYYDISRQIIKRTISPHTFALGVKRFTIGLGKKVLVANTMAIVADQIFALPPDQLSFPIAWLGIISYALQIYFDFSGYSDMAIGLGHMLGFNILENFNYPYISKSVKEFWRRWHISLSSWFRDYLYLPLGGNRLGPARTYINLWIVFILCGFWHGASWNFIIWGAFHGTFLIIERTKFGLFLHSLWAPVRHLYTILVVLIGWCFFRSETLFYALTFIKAMFSFNTATGSVNDMLFYLTPETIAFLLIGVIGSTPVSDFLNKKIKERLSFERHTGYSILAFHKAVSSFAFILLTFFLSVIYLASGTYNPFIYFRF